ncbi:MULTISPECIES: thioredoxin family protein [Dethiosulfovibrio]|jgi:small redox-active disulfide protein 2|uniref:Thioredoxin family protein n=2 Tax=Dethiosulfovibrio TaxID=47054 RepID=A0ABS9EN65_9BACT|nr:MULTISPECIES: thioredoxin family protein [Dethiosulfovibrio]MCF4114184.1 thioredoxin family protein [Dethiosulfovibrio russensis]MCF4142626.1 thioredoxin family protein [Dethiosulfovibrio marinus]MCF4145145.1 thioredoxin family protein [Dethiosulfovibrio acidaminovorans]
MTVKIQILGTGCPKCKKLAELAEAAAKELGLDYSVEKVTDISEIMEFGVAGTPGLVVNDKVVSAGRIPTPLAVKRLISEAL